MKDKHGREYAKLSQLTTGSIVEVDGGFDCIDNGKHCEVKYNPGGLYIDCDHGHHFLSGQLETDGDSLIGIYPV